MTSRRAHRRRLGTVVIVSCLALLAVQTTVWILASRLLEQRLAGVVIDAAAAGWSLSFGPVHYAGWPFAAGLDIAEPALSGSAGTFPPGAQWKATLLRIRLRVLSPTTLQLEPTGQQHLWVAGLPDLAIEARRTLLSVPLRPDSPVRAEAADVTAETGPTPLSIRAADLTIAPDAASARLSGIGLPGGTPAIDVLEGHAALIRPIPPGPGPLARARAWRDAGGEVDLTDLAINWGPFAATGSGIGRLDEHLQPAGQAELAATGIAPLLDRLAHADLIPTGAATAAKAVTAILAAPAPNAPVRLPIELKAGVVTIARFPLLRIPALEWE